MGKTKTVLITLGITFLVLFSLSLISQVGNNHQEIKDLECSMECAYWENSTFYEYKVFEETCFCYDQNSNLIASGEI